MAETRARWRYVAWVTSWVAYAGYYLGRKGFSVAKKTIRDTLSVSEAALGAIDTVYLAAYAAGQFGSGYLGDRVGARRLIGAGLLLSAAVCAAFGASSGALAFAVLFGINGLAQSTGWPGTTRAMAEWTTPRNRGTVMSFWATCYQVGGIVATAFAGRMLRAHCWRAAFHAPAIVMAALAVAVLLLLRPGPGGQDGAVGGRAPGAADPPLSDARRAAQRAALRNPVLWSYGASYFFIKYIRYALLFWLPYYLSTTLGYAADRAAYVSIAFEAGGVIGVIVSGTLSDRTKRLSRAGLSALSLLGLAAALGLCAAVASRGPAFAVASLALVGALLFSPDALLSGAAAQDAGGPHAAATATGFVNGVGSVGGMIEGLTLPIITTYLGWGAMFPLLAALAICAAVSLQSLSPGALVIRHKR
jgi:sugar phosphate permease